MADYADYTHVVSASFDPVGSDKFDWLDNRVNRAENLLKSLVPRLQNLADVSTLDFENARAVIVEAVLRVASNPKGIKSEQAVDQGFTRFDQGSGKQGIYFEDSELALFRTATKPRIGNISVAPPRIAQI